MRCERVEEGRAVRNGMGWDGWLAVGGDYVGTVDATYRVEMLSINVEGKRNSFFSTIMHNRKVVKSLGSIRANVDSCIHPYKRLCQQHHPQTSNHKQPNPPTPLRCSKRDMQDPHTIRTAHTQHVSLLGPAKAEQTLLHPT